MTRRIFLSASVPVPGRGDFHESANPFLIQFAIRELLTVCLGRRILVWGGHPAITPMVWAVCEDLDVAYSKAVVLYQSKLFADVFPAENQRFANCVYVDAVDADCVNITPLIRPDNGSRRRQAPGACDRLDARLPCRCE